MDNQIDSYLAKLNVEGRRNTWEGNRGKIDFILSKCAKYIKTGGRVCEVGIGDGYLLDKLYDLGMSCVGIDISGYLVRFLRNKFRDENKNIRLIQADIAKGHQEENAYDVIFCLDVLEHIDEANYREVLENIHSMLKKKGVFVASVPYMENMDLRMTKCPVCGHEFHQIGHKQAFDLKKIEDTVGAYFEIKEVGEVESSPLRNVASRVSIFKRRFSIEGVVRRIKREVLELFRNTDRDSPPKAGINIRPGATCYLIAEKV